MSPDFPAASDARDYNSQEAPRPQPQGFPAQCLPEYVVPAAVTPAPRPAPPPLPAPPPSMSSVQLRLLLVGELGEV